MERSFDRRATFRGRGAIEKYWRYQICGKQSNVSFRHVDSEMVRDADSPIAVVKWLAEFDNRRENRAEKAHKRVRFCQMAKLHFEESPRKSDDEPVKMKISYLEEYAQGMVGKSFCWPGIDSTADELWEKIRFDPPKPPPPVLCNKCGASFSSRTKLFAHIKFTEPQYTPDGKCICVPNEEGKERMRSEHVLVCLSVSYWCDNPHDRLIRAWKDARSRLVSNDNSISGDCEAEVSLTWAVPTELISSAVINVVTMKLPQVPVEKLGIQLLPKILNEELNTNNSEYGAPMEHRMMIVHTAGIVDRPCAPERREFELYAAYIPWNFFEKDREDRLSQSSNCESDRCNGNKDDVIGENQFDKEVEESPRKLVYIPRHNNPKAKKGELKKWRIPIEETSAFETVGSCSNIVQRLKHGARLMKDGEHLGAKPQLEEGSERNAIDLNQKLKVRTCAMEEPLHHYCKILVSVKQTIPGYVKRLVGLLCAYARFDLCEDDFVAALKDRTINLSVGAPGLNQYRVQDFPPDHIVLLEPAMTRFENKTKLKLCRYGKTNVNISENMEASIEEAQNIVMHMIIKQEPSLDQWVSGSKGTV